MPYIGQGLSEGTRQLYTYTATANQSVFSASYTPGKVDVFQNGVLLFPNDYTATDGATITLSANASLNDEISIIAQDVFSVDGNVSNNYLNTTLSTKVDETHTGNVSITGEMSVSGKVGIGTSSPAGPIDVVSDVNGVAQRIRARSTDEYGLIEFVENDGSTAHGYIGTPAADTLAFFTNGLNERMRINSSGHMTKADQPLFVGRFDNLATTATDYVIGVSQIYNRSMTFDSSTDRITAPTAGYYMIHAQQLYQSAGGIYMEVRVNGAAKFYGYGNMGTAHRDLVATGIWYLNANDYVDFRLRNTSIYAYGGGHTICYVQLVQ